MNIYKSLFYVAFLLFCFSHSSCQSQPASKVISGTITGVSGQQKIYLKGYKGNEIVDVDSSLVDKSGDFLFSKTGNLKTGLYSLYFKDYKADFAVNSREQNIVINTSVDEMAYQQLNISNSKEHAAFMELKVTHVYFLMAKDSIKEMMEHGNVSEQLEKYLHSKEQKYNNTIKDIQKNYPNTYTSDILIPLFLIPIDTDSKPHEHGEDEDDFYFHHFFDYVNFKDASTINNPFYGDKIFEYFSNYTGHDFASRKEGIDLLMQKAEVNETIKEFTLHYLLEQYEGLGDFDVLNYVLNNYYDKKYDSGIGRHYSKMKEDFAKLKTGNKAPELAFNTAHFTTVKLSEVKGKKAILVLFWLADCDDCKDLMPELIAIYNDFQPKGFEVIAVSIDTDVNMINSYVSALKMKWITVTDLKGWESPSTEYYSIGTTPDFCLIDGNMNIILRTNRYENVAQKLKEIFD